MSLRIDPTPLKDRKPPEWLLGRLASGRSVGSLIPDGLERYARILHPAHLWDEDGSHAARSVPWSEVSAWSGKPLHRASSIHDLARRPDGSSWLREGTSLPLEGQLEPEYLDRLTELLAETTSKPKELWLLVWHGYSGPVTPYSRAPGRPTRTPRGSLVTDVARDAVLEISRSLTESGRKYFLRRGSIEATPDDRDWSVFEEPPSFWWPEDRAWFVSTDIDSSSTYVGGSSALIDRLLAEDGLEVFPADLNDRFDGGPYDSEQT